MKRRDGGGSANLQHLLEQTLIGLDMGPQLRERAALRAWEQVAGRVVGAHARAEALRDGALIVATDSPAWAQELHMRQTELLDRLRTLVGPDVVREIHFRSGLRKRAEPATPPPGTPAAEKLTARQLQEVQRAAAGIGDPELRRRAERAYSSLTRIATWRRRKGWRQCARCGHWQRTGKRWCASCTYRRGEGT